MKLYHICQNENQDYDTFDSAVVCAHDEETARNTDPCSGKQRSKEDWASSFNSWCRSADAVTVKYLGEAADGMQSGVICASYNAG